MANQENNNRRKFELLDKNVELEPVGVVYNITQNALEDFVIGYLKGRNIDGVANVKAKVVREGADRPELALYVFIDLNSRDLICNMSDIPEHLKRKMDDVNYKLSEKLKQSLYPLCKELKTSVFPSERVLAIKCHTFKALGLMFACDPKVHQIGISEIRKVKRGAILSVVKAIKFVDKEDASVGDRYSQLINNIED